MLTKYECPTNTNMDITDEVRFRVSPDVIEVPPVRKKKSHLLTLKSKKGHVNKNAPIRNAKQQTPKLSSAPRLQAIMNKNGLIELDLSDKNLRDIPKQVYDLSRLEELNISSNKLRMVQQGISKLHRLKKLNASKNQILCLPETFTNLKHLKEIDLSHNQLQSLPSHFGVLQDLRILKLAHNKFETIPHNLCELAGLKVLELPQNKLWHLPLPFQNLIKLQRLSLAGNKFDQLPVGICRLKNLEGLDLHGNNLLSLPSDFNQLGKVQELNLARNKLEFVPVSVLHLKHLHSLDISENVLMKLPDRIDRLHRLRVLNVSWNKLNAFPNIALAHLEYLNLAGNTIRNFSVVQLKKLKYLSANANQLENIPLGVYNLSKLQILKLADNQIAYLSQDVILLQELRQLDLSNNHLKSLPQVINDLEKLETFNVKGNKLEERTVIEHGFPFEGQKSRSWHRQNAHIRNTSEPRFQGNPFYGTFRSEPNLNILGLKPEPMLYYPQNQIPLPVQHVYGQTPQYLMPHGGPNLLFENGHQAWTENQNPYIKSSSKLGSKRKKPFWSWKKKEKFYTPKSTIAVRGDLPLEYGRMDEPIAAPVFYTAPRKRPDKERILHTCTSSHNELTKMPTAKQRTVRGHPKRKDRHYGISPSVSEINGSLDMLHLSSPHDATTSRYARNGDVTKSSRQKKLSGSDYTARYAKYNDFAPVRAKSSEDIRNGSSSDNERKKRLYEPKDFFRKTSMGTVRSLSSLSSVSSDNLPVKSSWFEKQHRKRLPRSWGSSKATVADSETVGDALSLGEEDYLYQPTSVRDQRLVGVVSDVESLLNEQLLEPISEQQWQAKLFKPRMNVYGTMKTLRGLASRHKNNQTSDNDNSGYNDSNGYNDHNYNDGYNDHDYNGSYYNTGFLDNQSPNIGIYDTVRTASSVQSDSLLYGTKRFGTKRRNRTRSRSPRHALIPRDGVVAQQNDILMKRPDEVKEVRNEHYHRKEERFRVTTSGGIFRSSLDHTISVYFPMGAVDFPLTITMQVQRVKQGQLEQAKSLNPALTNLLALSSILHLKQNYNIEFLHQVLITMPVPPVAHGCTMHVLTCGRYGDFTPCNATIRRSHGYVTLSVRALAGKVVVVTRSKDKYKACASVEEFMNTTSG